MDRRNNRYDDDRDREFRDSGGRDDHGRDHSPEADPRLHRAYSEDRTGRRRSPAHGYGRDQRALHGRDQQSLHEPSAGIHDDRDEAYPDRGLNARVDQDMRRDHDRLSENRGNRASRGDRGFLDRASDEVASWFGDEEAEQRREQDHGGRGPKNYVRSDSRIQEDVNDALTDDRLVDASEITVKVKDCEVTLDGTVDSRRTKRHAEDCAESVSGVRHVQNNLRVSDTRSSGSGGPSTSIPS